MKIMDQEGVNMEPEVSYLATLLTTAAFPPASVTISNLVNRLPIKTNMGTALLAVPIAYKLSLFIMKFKEGINRENMATMKHYILTHPERFPEPKRTKYIDLIKP